MNENNQKTEISQANTLEGIGDFWDKHSLADYWDKTKQVEFQINVVKRRRAAIDPELYNKILRCSHAKGLAPETLINLWLSEKVRVYENAS